MSKFNIKSEGTKTINLAGGIAYKESAELELVSLVLTSFVEDKFYETKGDQLDRLQRLIQSCDPNFVGKLAVYARKEFNMRSISHVLIAELVKLHKGLKKYVEAVIQRPDDMLEILAFFGGAIPNSVKKGLAVALKQFNAYDLGKYKGKTKKVSLCDLINLIHPKGTVEQMQLWGSVLKGTISAPDTWEVGLSTAKNDLERTKVWERLISENKIGYMALLRNLVNLTKYNVNDDVIKKACSILTDPVRVEKSKQLPFRFYNAYQMATNTRLKDACAIALEMAVKNVPQLEGKTLVVVDVSGSMRSNLSEKGSTRYIDIATLFGAIAFKANPYNVDVMAFDDQVYDVKLSSTSSTLDIMKSIPANGGATELYKVFQVLATRNQVYDRIIIFSDMQCYGYGVNQFFNQYKQITNCNPKVYSVDLAGHGTLQFPEKNVSCLAGWSEKIFDMMEMLEQDKNILINTIKNYEI